MVTSADAVFAAVGAGGVTALVLALRWRGPPAVAAQLAFALAGFWWFAGAAATRVECWEGTAQYRTGTYFAVGNLAVAEFAVGPATWAGLTRLHDRRVGVLVIGVVMAPLVAHLSQYSRGEVHRIWLLFYPWLLVAGGAIVAAPASQRAACWVGLQALLAILLQAALVSKLTSPIATAKRSAYPAAAAALRRHPNVSRSDVRWLTPYE